MFKVITGGNIYDMSFRTLAPIPYLLSGVKSHMLTAITTLPTHALLSSNSRHSLHPSAAAPSTPMP
jgi:hypothetical protein